MSRAPPPAAGVAVAATLAAAALWGTSFNVNDAGLRHVGPVTFTFLRFAIAGGAMLALAFLLRRSEWTLVRDPWFWALAGANAAAFLLQYFGQTLTTPARTALFVNTTAFAVAALDRFFYGERIRTGRLVALIVGVAGAALVVTGGDPTTLEGGRLAGDLLVLSSGLLWSIYFVMNRRVVGSRDVVGVTAWTFALTALLVAPFLWIDAAPLAVPAAGAPAILYTGIATTALAFGLWTFGLRRLAAGVSAVLLLFEIVVAASISVAIGRETLTHVELAGAALIIGAVAGLSLLEGRRSA